MTKPLTQEFRRLLHHLIVILGKSVDEIFNEVCNIPNLNHNITKVHLKRLFDKFWKDSIPNINYYLMGPRFSSGRKRILGRDEISVLLETIKMNKTHSIRSLLQNFKTAYYGAGNQEVGPSEATVFRTLKRADITVKVIERRHVDRDEVEGLQYLHRVAHIDPNTWIDIDGTAHEKESFLCKRGRSKAGVPCILPQLRIGSQQYSVLAACTPAGFLCWSIFDKSVNSEMFCTFVDTVVRPYVYPNQSNCMIDNAQIHKTMESTAILEEVFSGNFYFVPKYSPHLKPIEPCFALVKEYIKKNESQAVLNPIQFINSAFNLFAIGNEKSGSIRGHWNGYFNLHKSFNDKYE